MHTIRKTQLWIWCLFILLTAACNNDQTRQVSKSTRKPLYESADLMVTQLAPHTYQHTSYLQTQDYGKVACNGMIVVMDGQALIFDTTPDSTSSAQLIEWVEQQLRCSIVAVVATHFHNDNLGGLAAFIQKGIPSYAEVSTLVLAKEENAPVPTNSFVDSIDIALGNDTVQVKFLGEGHTRDNVVGYFARDKALFGGCLIKAAGADKGYLGDANVAAWSATVQRVKQTFAEAEIIIPGHGEVGDLQLLDYTIELFAKDATPNKHGGG